MLSTSPILVEMYVAAAEKVVDAAFQSPERRARIMNPPADFMPPAFRRFKPPVRSPRENKVLRTTPDRCRSGVAAAAGHLRHSSRICRPGLPKAGDARRADAVARAGGIRREGWRVARIRHPARASGRAGLASFSLHRASSRAKTLVSKQRTLPEQDFELARGLSYFLWSSMPDDELLRLASQAALRRPDVLEAQVKRMLRDRRSRALAEQFASQWLQTRKLSTFTPDPKLFPEFDSVTQAGDARGSRSSSSHRFWKKTGACSIFLKLTTRS